MAGNQNFSTSKSRFGQAVENRLHSLGLTAFDLRDMLPKGRYEWLRKIIRGEAYPSEEMIRNISRALTMDWAQLNELASLDKVMNEYPTVVMRLAERDPELEPVERVWQELAPNQKQWVLDQVEKMVQANRQAKFDAARRTA